MTSEGVDRLDEVCDMLVNRLSPREIKLFAARGKWEQGAGEIDGLIKRAKAQIRERHNEPMEDRRAMSAECAARIYSVSLAKKDAKTALAALIEYNNIYGVHSPKKLDLADTTVRALTDDQLVAKLVDGLAPEARGRVLALLGAAGAVVVVDED